MQILKKKPSVAKSTTFSSGGSVCSVESSSQAGNTTTSSVGGGGVVHKSRSLPTFKKSVLGAALSLGVSTSSSSSSVAAASAAVSRGASRGSGVSGVSGGGSGGELGQILEPFPRRQSLASLASSIDGGGNNDDDVHSRDYYRFDSQDSGHVGLDDADLCNDNLATRLGKWAISLSGGGNNNHPKAAFISAPRTTTTSSAASKTLESDRGEGGSNRGGGSTSGSLGDLIEDSKKSKNKNNNNNNSGGAIKSSSASVSSVTSSTISTSKKYNKSKSSAKNAIRALTPNHLTHSFKDLKVSTKAARHGPSNLLKSSMKRAPSPSLLKGPLFAKRGSMGDNTMDANDANNNSDVDISTSDRSLMTKDLPIEVGETLGDVLEEEGGELAVVGAAVGVGGTTRSGRVGAAASSTALFMSSNSGEGGGGAGLATTTLEQGDGNTDTNGSGDGNNNNGRHHPPMTHPPLYTFRKSLNHSWINQLSPEDPENYELSTTKYSSMRGGMGGNPARPVFNGHYVKVRPTPLKNPKVVIHSPELMKDLGFHPLEVESEAFVKYFSGDVDGAFEKNKKEDGSGEEGVEVDDAVEKVPIETWATPYALSIMGKRYTSNCPFGTGDGYGDGRAISIGEVVVPFDSDKKAEDVKEDVDMKEGEEEHHLHQHLQKDDLQHLYPRQAARYELQLKGAGQTPFCRGADGRAVLRSSIREFLASEAMHHLGVSTTRALSLIVSDGMNGDTSQRPWYSDGAQKRLPNLPSLDDPRLAQYSDRQKREIISQLAAQSKADPDTLVEEKCAITTRVSPSFVRVGHLDLFARRVEMWQAKHGNKDGNSVKEAETGGEGMEVEPVQRPTSPLMESRPYQELEELMWHACYREYYDEAYWPYWESKDAKGAALALLEGTLCRIAAMVAGWVRVGFVQGNFNADNCLVGGRTMDYGPFGFLDVYHPLSAKWTGSGEHFGFMNQPSAGYANFAVLVESLLPIIEANGGNPDEVREQMLTKASSVFSESVDKVVRAKLGLEGGPEGTSKEADDIWEELEPLLRTGRGDWTLFWRQLTYVAKEFSPASGAEPDYDAMMTLLLGEDQCPSVVNPFYDPLTEDNRATLRNLIEKWHKAITKCYKFNKEQTSETPLPPPEEIMRQVNPKYTLREWMLVEAYSKADAGKFIPGDYTTIHELFELSKDPYGEGTPEMHQKYYRRAPDETLRAGGTAFMS